MGAAAVDKNGRKVMKVEMSAGERALTLVTGTPGEKLWANEPYFQPATRYQGLPKYMNVSGWAVCTWSARVHERWCLGSMHVCTSSVHELSANLCHVFWTYVS